jgi:hypothetical protein
MRKPSLVCVLAVASSLLITYPAAAASNVDTKPLRDAVTVNGIREHLAALEKSPTKTSSRAYRPVQRAHPGTWRLSTMWSPR